MNNKCWSIQWISCDNDIYEQIERSDIYLNVTHLLNDINEIIEDKKRDIEEDNVEPPLLFGAFTKVNLINMEIGDYMPLWKYNDSMVVVVARSIAL